MNEITLIILVQDLTPSLIEQTEQYNQFFDEIHFVCQKNSSGSTRPPHSSIYVVDFNNNFSDLRNAALATVSTEWVFFLDSDERLSQDLINNINNLTSRNDVDGYWISRRTYLSPGVYLRYGLFYPDYQLRLFRKRPDYQYNGALHELISIPEEKTDHIHYDILHYPARGKYTAFSDFKNLIPYITIETNELRKLKKNRPALVVQGIYRGISLFLGGFIRGKGFLDGWNGFRAHLLFSMSIALPYIYAGCT